ncbi:MAG: sigma-54 dependent transcriptional regulator [Opitutaceae bacterium]|jgi:DNA-binding NtrC family response regulator
MSLERILILDDEPIIQKVLGELFLRKKLTVTMAGSLAQAEALCAKETYDLMMVDVRLPDGDGQQFLERSRTMPGEPLVVIMTGHGSIESAVACMRAGAFDYLIKPFSPGQIEIIIKKAETYRQLLKVNRYFAEIEGADEGELIGRSTAMLRLRQLIERVAPTDATVLIAGENGTGKEMVARELYKRSPRKNEAYIKVNCAALSENLIASELFGHERGAFTGATERREGRFELANKGTILLDEVSEIPAMLQAKLLRVLQEREFERVGGTKTIKVNVRILATSNRDLNQVVTNGEFRQDLYYRLNVFPIHVPPLRDRRDDIALLAETFLQRFARKHGLKIPGFTDAAMQVMASYPWPGNVRELQNTIERAVILSESGRLVSTTALGLPSLSRQSGFSSPPSGTVVPFEPVVPMTPSAPTTSDSAAAPTVELPQETAANAAEPTAAASPRTKNGSAEPQPLASEESSAPTIVPLNELERRAIIQALQATGGNRTKAAEMLKISIRTLRNKLQEYREAGHLTGSGPDTPGE